MEGGTVSCPPRADRGVEAAARSEDGHHRDDERPDRLLHRPATAADRLARLIVEERLAACVQALPGLRATYRWEGGVQQGDETLLLIKTTADRYAALERTLAAHHPYELPEILAVDASAGLPTYLRWLADETASGEPGDAD